MANTFPNEFANALRDDAGLRIVDVLRDIILPEFASADVANRDDPLLRLEPMRTGVPLNALLDIEAERIRGLANDGETPTLPQPAGGDLPDVTWAFNQATGARPSRWEVASRSDVFVADGTPLAQVQDPDGRRQLYTLDPLTGERIYSRHEELPSLNRLPGIIVVPVGLFPILGTIRLFNGQMLMGVAPIETGSALIKIGDGPCISVQGAMARSLDPIWPRELLLQSFGRLARPRFVRTDTGVAGEDAEDGYNALRQRAQEIFSANLGEPIDVRMLRDWNNGRTEETLLNNEDPRPLRTAIRNWDRGGMSLRMAQLELDLQKTFDEITAPGGSSSGSVSDAWLPEDREGSGLLPEQRVQQMWARLCVGSHEGGGAGAHIRDLYIEQRDWLGNAPQASRSNPPRNLFVDATSNVDPPQAPQPWGRVARVPIVDAYGDVDKAAGYSHDAGGMRPAPNWYSSIGIEMLGCVYSLISNVKIANFTKGAGVLTRPRAPATGGQLAYYNQIRDVTITRCSTGLSAQLVTSLGNRGGRTAKYNTADGVKEATFADWRHKSNAANSTLMMRCTIEDFGRFGAEIHGRSFWLWDCDIKAQPPAAGAEPKGVGVVLGSGDALVRSCRIDGGREHVLFIPKQQFVEMPQSPQPPKGLPKADNTNVDLFQKQKVAFRVARATAASSGGQAQTLTLNRFTDQGVAVRPRLKLWEFNVRAGDLRSSSATSYWRPALVGREFPEASNVEDIDARRVDIWDMNAPRASRVVSIDQPDLAFSPPTMWTSTNLIKNSGFKSDADGLPIHWSLLNVKNVTITPELVDDAQVAGSALKLVVEPLEVPGSTIVRQVLVPELVEGGDNRQALVAYSRFRGKRVVFSCWVKASATGMVRLRSNGLRSQWNWVANEWQLLSIQSDILDRLHPASQINPFSSGSDFNDFAEIEVKKLNSAVAFLMAPAVNLGPDAFPVLTGPLADAAFGSVDLPNGIPSGFRLRLDQAQSKAGIPVVHDADLTHIMVDVRDEGISGESIYVVELYDETGSKTQLGEFKIDKNTEIMELDLPGVFAKTDYSLIAKHVSGPKRTLDVHFEERYALS